MNKNLVQNPIFAESFHVKLNSVLEDFDKEQDNKNDIIFGMDKLLKNILQSKKRDVGT